MTGNLIHYLWLWNFDYLVCFFFIIMWFGLLLLYSTSFPQFSLCLFVVVSSPCEDDAHDCSHVCLPTSGATYRCSCPTYGNLVLQTDNKTCAGELFVLLLPPANEVWGKSLFLHLSVILFTVECGRHPPRQPPSGQSTLRDSNWSGLLLGWY